MRNKLFFFCFLILTVKSAYTQSTTCEPGNVSNSNSDPWSEECFFNSICQPQGNPCQANDVNLVGLYLADSDGSALPIFAPGDVIDVYFWAVFDNGTNTNRYAVRSYTELFQDGIFVQEFNDCVFDEIVPGIQNSLLFGPIEFNTGITFELYNTWTSWETSSAQCSSSGLPNYNSTCGDYNSSKCGIDEGPISIFLPNFTFTCGEFTSTTVEICFENVTIGGEEPFQYNWDFGDGGTSSDENPCHTFNISDGEVEIVFIVTDGNDISAGSFFNLDLNDVFCPEPNLDITKDANPDFFSFVGQEIIYTINVVNSGNVNFVDVVVSDPLVNLNTFIPILAPGEEITYTEQYFVTPNDVQNDSILNTASVTGNYFEELTASDVSTVIYFISNFDTADLAITKTVNNTSVEVGDPINFTLTAENFGPDNATDVIVFDFLPSGYTYISDDGSGSYNPLTGIWSIGNLDNGDSEVLNITVTVNHLGNYLNQANIYSTNSDIFDPNMDNNADTAIVDVLCEIRNEFPNINID